MAYTVIGVGVLAGLVLAYCLATMAKRAGVDQEDWTSEGRGAMR